ncbi:poly(A) polymerase [Skeletonema marinoi]|uniref:polynucleotide adenylyltransferase n=1 Tax=Skeletonema marinoi TaxID=267567 RepID=A0AAD8YL38_9STRA|nr:poly(A) polymerase [Skeletonema marinoi]
MAKQPPTKRRKKSLLKAEQYDLIAEAWTHYKSYIGASDDDEEIEEEEELEEEEERDIDEIFEVVSLLSQLDIQTKKMQKKCDACDVFNTDSFESIQSILPIMFSMTYLHIANHSMSEELEQSPEYYLEQSLMYWPENPAANSLLADYHKQMNLGSDMTTICDLYVKAATYAGTVKDAAAKFCEASSEKEEDRFNLKEIVDILVMGGALDMSEEDDDDEQEEEEEDDEGDEEEFHSCSNVEVTSSFMAAMLLSCLDRHDDALVQLQKFRLAIVFIQVWKTALGSQDSDDKKKSAIDRHDYNNRGYYSYYFDITKKTRNVVEDAIVNHLLPMAERHSRKAQITSTKIVGAECKHEVSHPIVSSVLYLTGGGAGAGSTIVFDQTPDATENATQVWLSEPKNNHFMNFPGNLLHGVLPCVGGSSSDSDIDKNRLTLMVGFWTRDVTKGMKNRNYKEHSWVMEAQKKVKQASGNEVEATALKVASPAWETIDYPDDMEEESAPLDVPASLDHQYFVSNAPHCFTTRLTSGSMPPPIDLTATIGGRKVTPALPIVDGSSSPPNELKFNASLSSFISQNVPLESVEGIRTRERVLCGGELFTSGSYRLGVHEPGADIDTIVVVPSICTKEDFFGSGYVPPDSMVQDDDDEDVNNEIRDPDSLAERIRRHPDVTNFIPVEGAAVPILTFDWEGINIDLLFARLNAPSVPANFDIDNDMVLSGVDSSTEKSLNGPRVTNLIAALVGGTEERYQTFLTVVRLVRKWAKARGLYSNKLGYWGGVNINIAVALPHDAELGLPVWNAFQAATMRQVAPMITPAYPAMNSTLSVSRQTLQILHEEFARGHNVVDKLYKDWQKGDVLDKESMCIVGPSQSDAQSWAGFVVSRLRKLVSDQLGRSLPLKKIQLWPKEFSACVAERSALLTHAQRANSITYFIGFRVDTLRMRGSELDIERQLQNFSKFELSRFHPLTPGMDVLPKTFGVKELPKVCFEDVYEGGKVAAMKRRRMLIEADPKRIEAKNKKKLAKLKKKMEAMKRKKEESKASEEKVEADMKEEVDAEAQESRKRKRDGDDANGEDDNLDAEKEEEEEAALLESALDKIQDSAGVVQHKTREEAEIDRQKLLAGELLHDEDVEVKTEQQDRKLTREEMEKEMLASSGLVIVSDDEATIVGGNKILPWRYGYKNAAGVKKEEPDQKKEKEEQEESKPTPLITNRVAFKFKTKFDVVELDESGKVIDKGDDDFTPSLKWTGRKGGFEFKLGERGLGYYRTGKKVVIPSNMAYS